MGCSLKCVLLYQLFTFTSFVHGQNFFVQTTTAGNIKGKVQNVNGKNYGVFQGIPFAKPPVGNLRFQKPQPLDSKNASSSVDASNGFSKMCVQTMAYSEKTQSEDCLYLNVLTPKTQNSDNTRYPVMVWIYGGGFIFGSTNEFPVEGTLRNIVSRGVVFVSMNYRLGAFGFLTTRSSVAPGNYGLLDQVEALRWVQNNVQFFGGDPSKVTIFGESAGGASVSFLTISPITKGLFNQAIMMSGSAFGPWAMMYDGNPEDYSGNIMVSLGCRKTGSIRPRPNKCPYQNITSTPATPDDLRQHEQELACLQSKSVTEIASKVSALAMRPRIDGILLPESPENLMKKRNPYNLMTGVDAGESAFLEFIVFPGFPGDLAQTEAEFTRSPTEIDCKSFMFPDIVNFTAHYHYAHSATPASLGLDEKHFWFEQTLKLKSALMFWMPTYRDAVEATKTNSKVYLYSWDWKEAMDFFDPKKNFYWKGATHGSEMFALFDNNALGELFVRDGNHTRRDKSQDKKATEVFGKLFTNFAKFGNPTPDTSIDGVIWEPFSVKESNYLSIDMPKIKMAKKFYESDVSLWLNFLPNLEKSVKCAS